MGDCAGTADSDSQFARPDLPRVSKNMKTKNQNIWETKVNGALRADIETEARERLRQVWPYLSGKRREIQVFELVCVWGFSQVQVAEHLGVSQQAIYKSLKKFMKKNPDKKPRFFLPKIGFLPDGFHVVER